MAGAAFAQRPDLWAAVAQCPILDLVGLHAAYWLAFLMRRLGMTPAAGWAH